MPDVIRREECDAYIDCVWGWLEGLGTGSRIGSVLNVHSQ